MGLQKKTFALVPGLYYPTKDDGAGMDTWGGNRVPLFWESSLGIFGVGGTTPLVRVFCPSFFGDFSRFVSTVKFLGGGKWVPNMCGGSFVGAGLLVGGGLYKRGGLFLV